MPNGEILRFEDAVQMKLAKGFVAPIVDWYNVSAENTETFHELALRDPNLAVQQLPEFIERARNSAGPGTKAYEVYVGGANHDWTGPLIDVVGTVYSLLEVETRQQALGNIFGFLDQQNYFAAQDNVELVNEPWLVADILVNRDLYWCGYQQYVEMLEKHPNWSELFPHLGEVKSAFWMALAVSQPRFASDDVRGNFTSVFPTLVDRTQDAIAAITTAHAQNKFLTDDKPVAESVQASLFKYDHSWIPAIRRKIGEKKWIDLDNEVYVKRGEEHEWKRRSQIPALECTGLQKELGLEGSAI